MHIDKIMLFIMSYKLNSHKHIRIWISADQNSFLPFVNQVRFAEMRAKNPNDEICFAFDSKLLAAERIHDRFLPQQGGVYDTIYS